MPLASVVSHLWKHPSNRGKRLRTLSRAVMWQLRKRSAGGPMTLPIFNGQKLLCYPGNRGSGVMIYSSGWPDFDEMYFVARYLRPGDSFIDVGANIGIYSLLMGSIVGPTGRGVAFEAGSKAYKILCENLALNQQRHVEVRCVAIGPTEGKVAFLQNQDLTNRIVAASEAPADGDFAMMDCTTLDTVLDRPFALGKIDIEGAEPMAFEGGRQMLSGGKPAVWIMEFKDRLLRKFNWSAEAFAKVVQDLGYRFGQYDARANEITFSDRGWVDHENVIVVFESAIDTVRERLATGPRTFPGAPAI
ncbi:MAG: FkbM family methyltransferase [Phycisphaerales bacterium]|nr:FkbM family methyltransferase [Phycisphaerales bacterium]